jgi:hypothetical protein
MGWCTHCRSGHRLSRILASPPASLFVTDTGFLAVLMLLLCTSEPVSVELSVTAQWLGRFHRSLQLE